MTFGHVLHRIRVMSCELLVEKFETRQILRCSDEEQRLEARGLLGTNCPGSNLNPYGLDRNRLLVSI